MFHHLKHNQQYGLQDSLEEPQRSFAQVSQEGMEVGYMELILRRINKDMTEIMQRNKSIAVVNSLYESLKGVKISNLL